MEINLGSLKGVKFNNKEVSKVFYQHDGTPVQVWPIGKELLVAGIMVESKHDKLQLLSESENTAEISFNSIVLLKVTDGTLESVITDGQHQRVIPFKIENFAIGITCYFGEYSSFQGTGWMPTHTEEVRVRGLRGSYKSLNISYGLDENNIMFWEGNITNLTLRIPACGIEGFKKLYCGAFYPNSLYFEALELCYVPSDIIDSRVWNSVENKIKEIGNNEIGEISNGMFKYMDLAETSLHGTYDLTYKLSENIENEYKWFNIVVRSKANQLIVGTFVQEYHNENRIYFGVCQAFINKNSDTEKYIQTASSVIFEGKELNEEVFVTKNILVNEDINMKFSIAIPKPLENTISIKLSIANESVELENTTEIEWDNIRYSIRESKNELKKGETYLLKIK